MWASCFLLRGDSASGCRTSMRLDAGLIADVTRAPPPLPTCQPTRQHANSVKIGPKRKPSTAGPNDPSFWVHTNENSDDSCCIRIGEHGACLRSPGSDTFRSQLRSCQLSSGPCSACQVPGAGYIVSVSAWLFPRCLSSPDRPRSPLPRGLRGRQKTLLIGGVTRNIGHEFAGSEIRRRIAYCQARRDRHLVPTTSAVSKLEFTWREKGTWQAGRLGSIWHHPLSLG